MDRIQADNEAALVVQTERMLEEQARAAEITETRAKIVSRKIKEFALEMEMDWLELAPKGGARYFLIGDLVIAVRIHGITDPKELTSTTPNDVLWQHTRGLVGVDITNRALEVGRGTLNMVSYDTIRKAINDHPELVFEHKTVVPILFPNSGSTD